MVLVNASKLVDDQELLITAYFVAHRKLFGECLDLLCPGIFRRLGSISGAFVAQEIPSWRFSKSMRNPGDVDLLILPYSDGQLLLSYAVAVEVKIVRASFQNQGKSPNKLGISQACSLLEAGFPRAAVIHLITSDSSPEDAWQERHICTILDRDGRVTDPKPVQVDTLPQVLLQRCGGRLAAALADEGRLGYACAYINDPATERIKPYYSTHVPNGQQAPINPRMSHETLSRMEALFNEFPEAFVNVPCHPRTTHATKGDPFVLVERRRLLG